MRLVLSRKGFDASSGGAPSPILPDGTLVSLPIPDPASPVTYDDIRTPAGPLGPIVERLTHGRVAGRDGAHLDPDLVRAALPRPPRWRPVFGQSGAAQGHLVRQRVGPGDLFLFFGWFRRCALDRGALRFVPAAPDLHVVFGWLQVARVVPLAGLSQRALPWARGHPHFSGARGSANTLYLAPARLSLPRVAGRAAPGLPGAGVLPHLGPELVLSARPGDLPRGRWRLPAWMRGRLSHHADPGRWEDDGDDVLLRSVGRGQELVVDLDGMPEPERALRWIVDRLRLAARHRSTCARPPILVAPCVTR